MDSIKELKDYLTWELQNCWASLDIQDIEPGTYELGDDPVYNLGYCEGQEAIISDILDMIRDIG